MDTVILAPINEKRFSPYGLNYLESFNHHFKDSHQIPYLIFSNKEEYKHFETLNPKPFYPIINTEILHCSKPISQKKLFGTRFIFDNFSNINHVIITDIDIKFIKSIDLSSVSENLYKRKTFISSQSNNSSIINQVQRESAQIFFPNDFSILKEITQDFTQYFWFNDVPVYSREYFFEFLDYINYNETITKLKYTTFDFILYAWFLLLKKDYHLDILPIPPINTGSFIESQVYIPNFKQYYEYYNPHWIAKPASNINQINTFMQLHVDRK